VGWSDSSFERIEEREGRLLCYSVATGNYACDPAALIVASIFAASKSIG
jgi:hypothetical protein